MKKVMKMMLCGAAVLMMALLTNCSKPADKVQGTLKGYTITNTQFFQNKFNDGETVEIISTGSNLVDVKFNSEMWGTFLITGATVEKSGKFYTISGKGTAKMTHQGGTNTYDCNLSGNFINHDDAEISFEIPSVMGGTKIVFYAGNAPVEYLNYEE